MITEKQQEALKNLTEYVETYCNENGISVLMTAAISEEHPVGTEQICSSVILGNQKHIIGSLVGNIKAESRLAALLSVAFREADWMEGAMTTIPFVNVNMN